ncbi:hypothetical protein [Streptomyces albireticuli]|uniref:Uncharacterized protein n=1 Tax=Streptomyces albireticuli TaxID=1940 RepID=A0A2A2D7U3_9ACTN|nr:hypothetical protein [Streptomyces albireticuli]MCD9144359.1 hypothetical protein [Streptomyces albireticuli]MCD9161998.1 hypothetical protein [Streptomyces albireticuli]MCD9193996.1 hypothetical protein [Streptomyces albireticuli]PAU47516.1 hypothetical protein CK936_18140 [Streptomyces albireticuli]
MGYAYYTVRRKGEQIAAGYSVVAVCDESGCAEQIDRGLACLCGTHPGGDEYGCGGYFCGQHLFIGPNADTGDLCARCLEQASTAL